MATHPSNSLNPVRPRIEQPLNEPFSESHQLAVANNQVDIRPRPLPHSSESKPILENHKVFFINGVRISSVKVNDLMKLLKNNPNLTDGLVKKYLNNVHTQLSSEKYFVGNGLIIGKKDDINFKKACDNPVNKDFTVCSLDEEEFTALLSEIQFVLENIKNEKKTEKKEVGNQSESTNLDSDYTYKSHSGIDVNNFAIKSEDTLPENTSNLNIGDFLFSIVKMIQKKMEEDRAEQKREAIKEATKDNLKRDIAKRDILQTEIKNANINKSEELRSHLVPKVQSVAHQFRKIA